MNKELSVAVELARRAGQAVMDVYATDFAVAYKGKNDPVTEADRQGNDLIVKGLQEAFPGTPWWPRKVFPLTVSQPPGASGTWIRWMAQKTLSPGTESFP